MNSADMLTYVLRDVDHGITDSVRIAAADRIEALEAWKAEALEVLHWYASAEPVQLYRDFEIAEYQSRARRLVEKEDGRG